MSKENSHFVLEPEAIELLREYEIPYPDHGVAHSASEAVRIAERLGYPVVFKVVSPDVVHKSDVGGVLVGVENATRARDGFRRIVHGVQAAVPTARIEGILVCKQAAQGLEVIVGATEDAVFGPTIMFGLGGIFAEVLRDVSFRIAPLRRRDAEEMIQEIQAYPVLAGTRGEAPRDLEALVELLLRVSRMVTEEQGIKELDLNPVRLFEQGLLVLDVRLLVKEISTEHGRLVRQEEGHTATSGKDASGSRGSVLISR